MGKKDRNRRSKAAQRKLPSSSSASASAPPLPIEPEAPPVPPLPPPPPPPPPPSDWSSDMVSVVSQGTEIDEFFEKHRCRCHENCEILLSEPPSPTHQYLHPHYPPPPPPTDLLRPLRTHQEPATTSSSSSSIPTAPTAGKNTKKNNNEKKTRTDMSRLLRTCRVKALDAVEDVATEFRDNPETPLTEALMKPVSFGMLQMQDVLGVLTNVVEDAQTDGRATDEMNQLYDDVMGNVTTMVQAFFTAADMVDKKKKAPEGSKDGAANDDRKPPPAPDRSSDPRGILAAVDKILANPPSPHYPRNQETTATATSSSNPNDPRSGGKKMMTKSDVSKMMRRCRAADVADKKEKKAAPVGSKDGANAAAVITPPNADQEPPPPPSPDKQNQETATSSSNPSDAPAKELPGGKKMMTKSEVSEMMRKCRAAALEGMKDGVRYSGDDNPKMPIPESLGTIRMKDVMAALNDVAAEARSKGGGGTEDLHAEVMANAAALVQTFFGASDVIDDEEEEEEGNDGGGGGGGSGKGKDDGHGAS